MTEARIDIGRETIRIECDGAFIAPCGATPLTARHFTSDPPQPEDLTNAIGDATDHLDDALRELPGLGDAAPVVITGALARAIAAIEHGATVASPLFTLSRDAAEDVFRTVATEVIADRRRNPGLPTELVDQIIAGCCVLVAIMRSLRLDEVAIETESGVDVDVAAAHLDAAVVDASR